MARPSKNTVDYFPFYCEEGKKMFYLEETYGNDGFATFVKLLRELAKTEYHYLYLSNKTTKMFLSAKCRVSIEVLESIINDLVDLGKFDAELWNENSIIWCESFIDGISDAYNKRSNNCINKKSLLTLLDSLGVRKLSKSNRKPNLCTSEGGENPQTKLKKTKLKETKEDLHPLQKFILNECSNVQTIKKQLTFENCTTLLDKYPKTLIKEKLEAMENKPNLKKNYLDVYRTLNSWCKQGSFINNKQPSTSSAINDPNNLKPMSEC